MKTEGKFYIGKTYDAKKKMILQKPTLYDPNDLTTHGVVVGMTGSGKTGLCIDILEEAALNGIPALVIDPKGDIANLLLHFPSLSPQDFEPWVDADTAQREGKSAAEMAEEVAVLWKSGLAEWDIDTERIVSVRQAVDYAVYTPGSDAGIPISILTSLQAPVLSWDENREAIREKISSTATALLGLVGIEADPVKSREHILLANLIERSWVDGEDLDLSELIRQIQNPPFERLGAFEMDQFYSEEDRFELAVSLNNLLAAPSFEAWVEGTPLDIEAFLWGEDGKPKQSVFYLAHLPDAERMFFVTLLLTALETWMYQQSGSDSLRALLYIDEMFGFMPPVAKPPSKPPLLRLLKQARAFGLGLLLTTQNPADLDYKGLSNAGTWFIGRLQTERDKLRLLEGLEGIEAGKGGFSRAKADKSISSLGKRVFLLHNVHEKAPEIFHTRWAMAYLKGPITRTQLKDLNALVGADAKKSGEGKKAAAKLEKKSSADFSATRPVIPTGVEELYLANNLTVAQALKSAGKDAPKAKRLGIVYRPSLLAQASVRYLDRKYDIDHEDTIAALSIDVDPRGVVHWDDVLTTPFTSKAFDSGPAPESQFSNLEKPLSGASTLNSLESDFLDYIYHSVELTLETNPALELVARPGVTTAEFREQCAQAAQAARDEEAETLREKYEKKIKSIQTRLTKEERELAEDQAEHQSRKMEELATLGENLLGLIGGSRSRRRVSTSVTKRRMTAKAKADVEESLDVIEEFKQELAELEAELSQELDELDDRWGDAASQIEELKITPYKKNILVEHFGVAWYPFWQLEEGGKSFEVPGFSAA